MSNTVRGESRTLLPDTPLVWRREGRVHNMTTGRPRGVETVSPVVHWNDHRPGLHLLVTAVDPNGDRRGDRLPTRDGWFGATDVDLFPGVPKPKDEALLFPELPAGPLTLGTPATPFHPEPHPCVRIYVESHVASPQGQTRDRDPAEKGK